MFDTEKKEAQAPSAIDLAKQEWDQERANLLSKDPKQRVQLHALSVFKAYIKGTRQRSPTEEERQEFAKKAEEYLRENKARILPSFRVFEEAATSKPLPGPGVHMAEILNRAVAADVQDSRFAPQVKEKPQIPF